MPVRIEGYSLEELAALSDTEVDAYLFTGRPVVCRIGSAELLGDIRLAGDRLIVELAHIDGGGEGVLPTLAAAATALARRRGWREIEWIVHAVHCARPNLKLRRVLERLGFVVVDVPGVGPAYHQVVAVQ